MNVPAQLAALAVFSSLSMNLLLQCGLGMRGSVRKWERPVLFLQTGTVFLSVLLLWVIFSYILSLGFFEYLLLFPSSALVYAGLERPLFRLVLKKDVPENRVIGFCDGLTAGSLFLTLHLASGFIDAVVLALGFVLGVLLAFLILNEIRRRSCLEAVPRFLRGSPLALISMGLLSLIFSSAALMFYQTLGG